MKLGEFIRYRREHLGLSQEELAKRCGYANNSVISNIEYARDYPSYKKLWVIARALETTVLEMMKEVDEK